jgi:hypothetical protein
MEAPAVLCVTAYLIGRVEDKLAAAMHEALCRAWLIATSDPMLQLDNDG